LPENETASVLADLTPRGQQAADNVCHREVEPAFGSKTEADLLGNRKFESTSLQQRVKCEPDLTPDSPDDTVFCGAMVLIIV
jgi:hypothetical protein